MYRNNLFFQRSLVFQFSMLQNSCFCLQIHVNDHQQRNTHWNSSLDYRALLQILQQSWSQAIFSYDLQYRSTHHFEVISWWLYSTQVRLIKSSSPKNSNQDQICGFVSECWKLFLWEFHTVLMIASFSLSSHYSFHVRINSLDRLLFFIFHPLGKFPFVYQDIQSVEQAACLTSRSSFFRPFLHLLSQCCVEFHQ